MRYLFCPAHVVYCGDIFLTIQISFLLVGTLCRCNHIRIYGEHQPRLTTNTQSHNTLKAESDRKLEAQVKKIHSLAKNFTQRALKILRSLYVVDFQYLASTNVLQCRIRSSFLLFYETLSFVRGGYIVNLTIHDVTEELE